MHAFPRANLEKKKGSEAMSIYSRRRKCDGIRVYCIQYKDLAGRIRTETAGTERSSAIRLLGQRMEEVKSGRWIAPEVRRQRELIDAQKREGLNFKTLAERFEKECLNRYVRKRDVVACLKRLVTFFGSRQIDEITRLMVERYKSERSGGTGAFKKCPAVGPRSVNLELSFARKVINWAIWELDLSLSRNVFSHFRALNESEVRRKAIPPTVDEFRRLLDASEARLRPVLLTAWFTGMRRSEVEQLKIVNVNLPWRRIVLEKTKNGDSRQIVIHSSLLPVLEKAISDSPSEFVFPGKKDRPFNTRKPFEEARRKAGLPNLWFHDLRKAFVTFARGAGHPDRTVAAIAGHRDMRVSDLYTIPTESQMRAAVQSIPDPFDEIKVNKQKYL